LHKIFFEPKTKAGTKNSRLPNFFYSSRSINFLMQALREKYDLCREYTSRALQNLEIKKHDRLSKEFLAFAMDYYTDAQHYAKKGDYVTALEAVAYAHGFIDAGVMAGLFEVKDYHLKPLEK
jgi:hypothetical protein